MSCAQTTPAGAPSRSLPPRVRAACPACSDGARPKARMRALPTRTASAASSSGSAGGRSSRHP
eukprot:3802190-Prymnesium_polylepis.1